MADESHVVIRFSSAPSMLKQADALLTLAQLHSEDQQTIAACVVVIVAAALDLGTMSLLDFVSKMAEVQDVPPAMRLAQQLKSQSFRTRIMDLPKVLSAGELQLNHFSPTVKTIHRIISLRNTLMHVKEDAHHREVVFRLSTDSDSTPQAQDELSSDFEPSASPKRIHIYISDQKLPELDEDPTLKAVFEIDVPENPWKTVNLDDALSYRIAAGVYNDEVLEPSLDIVAGTIVIPV